jgi:hypothetical protein
VLLVQPPQPGLLDGFANALVDLANYVTAREPGVEVSILDLGPLDLGAAADQLKAAIRHTATVEPIIGITTTTASYQAALAMAAVAKNESRSVLTVLGGHHAGPQHDVVLRKHGDILDCVIRGEGERGLRALVRGDPLDEVPGLTYLDRDGIQANPLAQLLSTEELDSLSVDFEHGTAYSTPGKFDHVTYVSARGCPMRCAFCSVAGEPIRAKSVPRVIEDVNYLVAGKNYRRLAIEDNFFAHKRARTLELCNALKAYRARVTADFSWDCQTRVESLGDPEILDALECAGCDAVYIGVEALTEAELTFLGKTSQPARYIARLVTEVVPRLLSSSVDCFINLQVGIPVDSENSRAQRIARLCELGRMAASRGKTITVFPQLSVMYPGTAYYWKALEQRAFGEDGPSVFERFTEWEAHHQPIVQFLGENFAHGVGGLPIAILRRDLLAHGAFEIDFDGIADVRAQLDEIETVPGITLFKYGQFLARTNVRRIDHMTRGGSRWLAS